MSAPVMRQMRGAAPWVVTAAGCAALVCLVGWPRPTLYAVGLVVGASSLLAGLRLLATERRAPAGRIGGRPEHPGDRRTGSVGASRRPSCRQTAADGSGGGIPAGTLERPARTRTELRTITRTDGDH